MPRATARDRRDHDTSAALPGATGCYVRVNQGLYPEFFCSFDSADPAALDALSARTRACLADWSWRPRDYSGARANKDYSDQDHHYIEVFDNRAAGHLELHLHRQCFTRACFTETNPGLLE